MVKLAATLPKEHDDNGLEPNSRHFLARYTSQEYTPAVVLLRTKDVHHTEDFERVPRVEVVHVEPAFDADDAQEIRDLIVRLHDDRVGHMQPPLDLPTTDEPAVLSPLALEAGEDIEDADVIDTDNEEN